MVSCETATRFLFELTRASTWKSNFGFYGLLLRPPWPATGVSRALRARSVSRSVPENRGVSESVPRSVSGALRAPGSGVSKKCPESVPGVSKRCLRHSGDTLGTLFGHSGTRGPKGPGDTPWDTLGDTPVFGDTLGDTPGDTSGPKGPRDPCSRPGGSQAFCVPDITHTAPFDGVNHDCKIPLQAEFEP